MQEACQDQKWDVKNGIVFVFQFFSLISDVLGGVTFCYDNKAWSVKTDENTVTVQDYLPKISQQSYNSTLFTTLGLTILA